MDKDHVIYAFHAMQLLLPGYRYQVVTVMKSMAVFFSPYWVSEGILEMHIPDAVLQIRVDGVGVLNKQFVDASIHADAWRREMLKRLYQDVALVRKDTYPVVSVEILGGDLDLIQTMLHDVVSLNDGDQPLLKRDVLDAALASRTKLLLREEYEAWSLAAIDVDEHLDYIVDDGPRLEAKARDDERRSLLKSVAAIYHRYMAGEVHLRQEFVMLLANAEGIYLSLHKERDFFTDLNSLVMEAPAKKAV